MEQDKEEGEMSDDTEMLVDEVQEPSYEHDKKCTVLYTADKSGVLVKKLNKIDASKLEDRAKRFGLDLSGNRIVTQTQIDELYNNFGIESGNERHFKFDTLHLNGVNGLTTKDIFEYLEDYRPVSLEWIDDNSCNIVCQDHISVGLALLVHSREIKNKDVNDMLHQKSAFHWREGMPHPKTDLILMRFATNSDKKMSKHIEEHKIKNQNVTGNQMGKNPWGDLCRSWGVYDHQEVFQRSLPKTDYEEYSSEEHFEMVQIKNKRLAMRLGKRSHKVESDDESSSSDTEWKTKSKTPRMRMRADDEETKQKKQNLTKLHNVEEDETFAPLSIEVVNSRSTFTPRDTMVSEKFRYNVTQSNNVHRNIQSRLGVKITPEEEVCSSDDSSTYDSDHNEHTMSRIQKVTSRSNKPDVWSRLEDKPNNVPQNDLRQILKTRKHKSDDLREKLGKSKQCNLRIEIDNNYADE